MCGLFSCIPIFRGVFIKKCKKNVYVCAVKNRIVTCEKCMFCCDKKV